MPGPLQVIAASFRTAADFQGRVLAEVGRLQGRGVLRLVDLLFVAKNEAGEIERLIVGGDDDFGVLLSRIIPLGGAHRVGPASGEGSPGFDPSDALALAETLQPGTALALLLIEHGWAQPLFDAIAETGGALLGDGFLSAEAGLLAGAEVAAVEEAAEVISAAHAAEARAVLRAMTAEAEADEAVAASEAIRAAAAADALEALIDAGIVEEAAAQEALDALSAAGVIIAAADQASAEAVAEDTAVAAAADQAAAEAVAEDTAVVRAADQAAAEAVAEDTAVAAAADQAAAEAVAEDTAVVRAADQAAAEAVAEDTAVAAAADQAAAEAVAEDTAVAAAADQAAAEAVAEDTAVAAAADAAAEGQAKVIAASISMSEARVLRYLPTPLTFALIADKLGISRSAAKERAERVYKKLGVHSRAEAVSRARALGLID